MNWLRKYFYNKELLRQTIDAIDDAKHRHKKGGSTFVFDGNVVNVRHVDSISFEELGIDIGDSDDMTTTAVTNTPLPVTRTTATTKKKNSFKADLVGGKIDNG